MLKVVAAEYAGGLRLDLRFNDGLSGLADFEGLLDGPVFQPLNDQEVFRSFRLTDHTVEWECGADFAPEYLHDLVVAQGSPAKATGATS